MAKPAFVSSLRSPAQRNAVTAILSADTLSVPLAAGCVMTHGSDEGRGPTEGRIDRDLGRLRAANQLQDRGIVNTKGERLDRHTPRSRSVFAQQISM
jgi:hypothetical protein